MGSVIITANCLRHRAYAKMVCNTCDIDLIVFEKKDISATKPTEKECQYFCDAEDWTPMVPHIVVGPGEANSSYVEDAISSYNPDCLFIFGCSLLKKKIWSLARFGCINIHTGIVQLFRGVDSSTWAIRDQDPSGIGATVHYVNDTIDSGEIIVQSRPKLAHNDDLDDLFLKSCACGFNALSRKIPALLKGDIDAKALKTKGKLYQNKDMNDDIIDECKFKIVDVISFYLEHKDELDSLTEIYE